MSKERPILFNTEMVQAIQAGRKTQTRRLVKEIPLHAPYFELCDGTPYACDMYGEWHPAERFCRIQPGDILWVRETWCDPEPDNYMVPVFYKADMPMHWNAEDTAHGEAVCITADEFKWQPSIHMPKDFARIFLRVKDVRLERLQDIKNHECVDEGAVKKPNITKRGDLVLHNRYKEEFARLWDTTIKPADRERYGWNANPWVWVITFERCPKPEGWC